MKLVQEQEQKQQNQGPASHPIHHPSRTAKRKSDRHDQTGSTDTMRNLETSNIYHLAATTDQSQYQPTAKDLMLFIAIMRRTISRTIVLHDQQRGIVRRCRRQARKLREYAGPFDGARIAAWEAIADDAAAGCKTMRECLKSSGHLLTKTARMVDAGLTLEQRCEILNVNKAHCGDLTDADGLIEIVYMHGLEDSAARVKDDWKNGPLFQAAQEVFMDFLTNHAEGRKIGDSLFQPGGMLADVATFKEAADGTMQRQPPRLHVVPDALNDAAFGGVL
jgi:hypothetical protein